MPAADPDRRYSVLVVEDESLVRWVLAEELEEAGFSVIEAENGEKALHELERNPDLKALLTDIEMPGSVDGLKLAKITSERYPDAAVLVVSGRKFPAPDELPPRAKFMGKPYQYPDVIAALHRMMGSEER